MHASMYVRFKMLSACTQPIVLAMCPVVTGCGHMGLVAPVDYRS